MIDVDWLEFFDRLEGPEGVNFDEGGFCTGKIDRPLSRRILASMGLPMDHIEQCLTLFEEHGGYCDCEVVMNARDHICPETVTDVLQ